MNRDDFILETPVVLIIFNRPEHVSLSFNAIKEARPQKLFIIADGPRRLNESDKLLCAESRRIVEDIDWSCEVHRIYADENLGCGERVSSGLTEVFNVVDKAIIIEDDVVASISFFKFCQDLLSKYENSKDIYSISGLSYDFVSSEGDYFFSIYHNSCAWATWKKVWDKYDYSIKTYPELLRKDFLKSTYTNPVHRRFWYRLFEEVYHKKNASTWACQFMFMSLSEKALHIYPNRNLVQYIGFSENATHAEEAPNIRYKNIMKKVEEIRKPLNSPLCVEENKNNDLLMLKEIYFCDDVDKTLPRDFSNEEIQKINLYSKKYIYGAGKIGKEIAYRLIENDISDFEFVVTDNKEQTKLFNSDVKSIEEIDLKDAVIIVSASTPIKEEMINKLNELKFDNYICIL